MKNILIPSIYIVLIGVCLTGCKKEDDIDNNANNNNNNLPKACETNNTGLLKIWKSTTGTLTIFINGANKGELVESLTSSLTLSPGSYNVELKAGRATSNYGTVYGTVYSFSNIAIAKCDTISLNIPIDCITGNRAYFMAVNDQSKPIQVNIGGGTSGCLANLAPGTACIYEVAAFTDITVSGRTTDNTINWNPQTINVFSCNVYSITFN